MLLVSISHGWSHSNYITYIPGKFWNGGVGCMFGETLADNCYFLFPLPTDLMLHSSSKHTTIGCVVERAWRQRERNISRSLINFCRKRKMYFLTFSSLVLFVHHGREEGYSRYHYGDCFIYMTSRWKKGFIFA